MIKSVIAKGSLIKLRGTCCEARGVAPLPLIGAVEVSTMGQLAQWTAASDKVLVF